MPEAVENGKVIEGKIVSTCHDSPLDASRGDGVFIGWCRTCSTAIVRINPRTGTEEYLDSRSPWTQDNNLRPVKR